jgi:hypothetical protein
MKPTLKNHMSALRMISLFPNTFDVDVEKKMVDYVQEMIIRNPRIYVARTKDVKTQIEYFTAKTKWPVMGGKTIEVKIHLGRAADFGYDTKNINARTLAFNKMKETLRRRKDMKEI